MAKILSNSFWLWYNSRKYKYKEVVIALVIALQILEAILSIALIAVVVLQSGKGGGLSGSIGGGTEGAIGGKTKGIDELLSKTTMVLGVLFAIVTLTLVKLMS